MQTTFGITTDESRKIISLDNGETYQPFIDDSAIPELIKDCEDFAEREMTPDEKEEFEMMIENHNDEYMRIIDENNKTPKIR